MATYIALLRKDPDSDFGVDFPDFPGCITAGSTLEETRAMAAEALELHIEGMLEENLPIPEPSRLDVVMNDPENAEAIPFPVSVPDQLSGAGQIESSCAQPTSRSSTRLPRSAARPLGPAHRGCPPPSRRAERDLTPPEPR